MTGQSEATRIPRKVAVLSTGGTIASRGDTRGAWTARDDSATLTAGLATHPGLTVDARDVLCVGSYLLAVDDMLDIAGHVRAKLFDDDVTGVVVTHGTDTMEETAFLADLIHDDARPVIFTGAQRGADADDCDGPGNLADAVTVAASPHARNLGVLIVFAGQIFAVTGTRKTHTLATAAFSTPDAGPIGRVRGEEVVVHACPLRRAALKFESLELSGVRVDIVPYYPGADTTALRAVTAAGATGVVLEATGTGNANPAFCDEIARLTANGVVVALTTRVSAGPVAALYGAGGGVDLLEAGAIPVGTLRAAQARILLTAVLAAQHDPDRARHEFRRRTGG